MQSILSARGLACRYRAWRCLALAPLLLMPGVHAQNAAGVQAPGSRPQRLSFESVFKDYQPFSDEKPVPWKAANDTVGQIGGWRAYARQARGPASATAAPAEGAVDPHAGHHKP